LKRKSEYAAVESHHSSPEPMHVKTPCTWRMKPSPSKTTKAASRKKRVREEAAGSAAVKDQMATREGGSK
jgi:hypothetical protein